MNKAEETSTLLQAPVAVVLAWLIPGLGHIYLGHKVRGIIFFVAITLTFGTGVAIGGVKSIHTRKPGVDVAASGESDRSWWFFAQIINGAYAITSYTVGKQSSSAIYLPWPSGDVASVYTGVAGMLNLLIILDALARAEGFSVPVRGRSDVRSIGPPRRGDRRGG